MEDIPSSGATSGDPDEGGDDRPGSPGLSAKLGRLTDAYRRATGQSMSNARIATGLTEQGRPVSASFIGYLRDGKRDNPTMRVLQGLAEFFEVPVAYFFDDEVAAGLDSQLELLAALQDSSVRSVATRMPGLRPETRRWLAAQMPALMALERGAQADSDEVGATGPKDVASDLEQDSGPG